MKKFILFLFLVTSISIHNAYAQDIEDEFADPTLETGNVSAPDLETSPPEFKPSTEVSSELQPGETPVESSATKNINGQPSFLNEVEASFQPVALQETQSSGAGDVIVEQQADLTESYKKRRGRHGILFSINYEKFNPVDYYSMYGDKYVDEFLGDSDGISLLSVELGYKLNFKLGSLGILANFAHGNKSNSNYSEDNGVTFLERGLSLNRYGLSLNFALDNVMQEPWVVPYGQVGVHQFTVSESFENQATNDTTTQIAFNYRVGLMFQLNWIEKSIDPNTQIDGLRSSGLQNTFLDIFASTYMASNETYDPAVTTEEGDPDLSTGMDIGIGLKMEF